MKLVIICNTSKNIIDNEKRKQKRRTMNHTHQRNLTNMIIQKIGSIYKEDLYGRIPPNRSIDIKVYIGQFIIPVLHSLKVYEEY